MNQTIDSLIQQFTASPRKGTSVADLSDRDRLALAIAAGAPFETVMDGHMLTLRTTELIGIADRGDGGYIVAIGKFKP